MGSLKGVKRGPYNKVAKGTMFTCLFYTDSAIENWKEKLFERFPKVCISPLHDKDIKVNDDGTEELKKPHYHVYIETSVVLNREQFVKSVEDLGAVVPPDKLFLVGDKKKILRYFCHIDEFAKVRYNPCDVLSKNIDYEYFLSDRDCKVQLSGDVLNLIYECSPTSLLALSRLVFSRLSDEHYSELKGNAFYYKTIVSDYNFENIKSKGDNYNE